MGNPTWRYRNGEARLFDSDDLPGDDWKDTPQPAAVPASPDEKQANALSADVEPKKVSASKVKPRKA